MEDLCKKYFPKEMREAQEAVSISSQRMLSMLNLNEIINEGEEQEEKEEEL